MPGLPRAILSTRATLVAWDSLTLGDLWSIDIPPLKTTPSSSKFEGIVDVVFDFVDLCVEYSRVQEACSSAERVPTEARDLEEWKRKSIKDAIRLLVASAARSGGSSRVQDEVDKDRSGIAMWRIP